MATVVDQTKRWCGASECSPSAAGASSRRSSWQRRTSSDRVRTANRIFISQIEPESVFLEMPNWKAISS